MTRRSLLLLFVVAATWGASYLLIDVSLRGMAAPVVAFGRVAVGATVLVAVCLLGDRRAVRALRGRWGRVAVFAVFQMAAPYLLIALGETRIPSGLASTLVATQPMWLVVLGPLAGSRVRVGQAVGVAVGFVGVVALVDPFGAGGPRDPLGVMLVTAAAVSYAVASLVLGRLLRGVPALPLTAAGEVIAALVMLPFAVATRPTSLPPAGSVVALLVLGAAGTAGGFALYTRLVADAGPGPASLVSYLAPVFALGYGALVLRERPHPAALLGFALILAGSALGTRRRPVPPAGSPPDPAGAAAVTVGGPVGRATNVTVVGAAVTAQPVCAGTGPPALAMVRGGIPGREGVVGAPDGQGVGSTDESGARDG